MVENRARVVEAFFDIRGYRGIPKHRSHLLCDGHEGIAQDLQSNRVRAREIARRPHWGGALAVSQHKHAERIDFGLKAGIDHNRGGVVDHQSGAPEPGALP